MDLLKDLRYAVHSLRRHPAFALTAILTIALGIGASTAIFSVANAVLLRPLPYARPEQLVLVWIDLRARSVSDYPFSPPALEELREQSTSFQGVAGLVPSNPAISIGSSLPEQVRALGATTNLLSLLGVRVALGRDFVDADGSLPKPGAPTTAPTMVILSHEYWARRFGGDSSVIGKSIELAGGPAMIVGVLAPGFEILFPPNTSIEPNPDVIVAQRIDFVNAPRFNTFLRVVARLKPGVPLSAARNDVERVAASQRERFTISKTANAHYRVETMADDLVADVRGAIVALTGAVIFVLLIACANVANLLLVRLTSRERELSIRAALGGSSGRLVRQLLAEALVLSSAGAAVGLGLAAAGIKLLVGLAPANVPRLGEVGVDARVLGFAIALAVIAAALFGVLPAIRASRPDLAKVLRSSGRTPHLGAGKLLRSGVVVAEVALSVILLVGGGLMVRSFIALARIDPGIDPKGVLTFAVGNRPGRSPDQQRAFVSQLRTNLAALPGVTGVTAATPFPLDGQLGNARWGTEEAASDPSKFQQADVHIVLPGFFETMHARLIAGRTFTEEDNRREFTGVIIDNLFAAKAFPGTSPIGKRLYIRTRAPDPEWLYVIGVVAHERHTSLITEGREAMFLPDQFFGPGTAARWAIRVNCAATAKCDPASLAPAVRKVVADLDARIPVAEMKPLTDYVDRAMSGTRFSLVLIAVFAAVAAVLACVGIYGVLATAVRQRTSEIGVRMTYGATRRDIFSLVIGDGMRLSVTGLVLGLGAAALLTRVMHSMLVGVQPTDPVTYMTILMLFLVVAGVACLAPAWRAARLDPVHALRAE